MISTKQKGDIGLTHVIARVTELGWNVSLPIGEHLPYDLVIENGGSMKRVQVKYVSERDKCLEIPLRGVWSNKSGAKVNKFKSKSYDLLAVFCPENKNVYFVCSKRLKDGQSTLKLRLEGDDRLNPNIHWAKDYFEILNMETRVDVG